MKTLKPLIKVSRFFFYNALVMQTGRHGRLKNGRVKVRILSGAQK
jgi:hypothetical protein